jgi:hypothetical protein
LDLCQSVPARRRHGEVVPPNLSSAVPGAVSSHDSLHLKSARAHVIGRFIFSHGPMVVTDRARARANAPTTTGHSWTQPTDRPDAHDARESTIDPTTRPPNAPSNQKTETDACGRITNQSKGPPLEECTNQSREGASCTKPYTLFTHTNCVRICVFFDRLIDYPRRSTRQTSTKGRPRPDFPTLSDTFRRCPRR